MRSYEISSAYLFMILMAGCNLTNNLHFLSMNYHARFHYPLVWFGFCFYHYLKNSEL
jgi:hypothetical protein